VVVSSVFDTPHFRYNWLESYSRAVLKLVDIPHFVCRFHIHAGARVSDGVYGRSDG
jgi:hypothetical protein